MNSKPFAVLASRNDRECLSYESSHATAAEAIREADRLLGFGKRWLVVVRNEAGNEVYRAGKPLAVAT